MRSVRSVVLTRYYTTVRIELDVGSVEDLASVRYRLFRFELESRAEPILVRPLMPGNPRRGVERMRRRHLLRVIRLFDRIGNRLALSSKGVTPPDVFSFPCIAVL